MENTKKYRTLKDFYSAEITFIKSETPHGGLSDLDRSNAWQLAEQHMLDYLLELIIEIKRPASKDSFKPYDGFPDWFKIPKDFKNLDLSCPVCGGIMTKVHDSIGSFPDHMHIHPGIFLYHQCNLCKAKLSR